MSVATYTKSGAKATTPAKLDKKIFGVEVKNHELLKSAYLTYLANGRLAYAKTKTRGQVRGGGRKPYRQKGTGRARFGSSRNPVWRGGGIAFGPTGQQNYALRLDSKLKRATLRQALSLAAQTDKIVVVEDVALSSAKTADAQKFLTKIGVGKNVLIAVDNKTPEVDRALRNLPNVKLVQSKYLSVFDVLNADSVVVSKKALEIIHEWLGSVHE